MHEHTTVVSVANKEDSYDNIASTQYFSFTQFYLLLYPVIFQGDQNLWNALALSKDKKYINV